MTVFDSIKNKNVDEFAEWLDKLGNDNAPWWRFGIKTIVVSANP